MIWGRAIVALLLFWVAVLLYMSLTLQSGGGEAGGGAVERMERSLVDALVELEQLKSENKKLLAFAKQLQHEVVTRTENKLKLSNKHSHNRSAAAAPYNQIPLAPLDSNNIAIQSGLGTYLDDEPSQSHEVLRRAVSNGVQEQWYYIGTQLRRIKSDVEAKKPDADWLLKRLEDVLATGLDYKRTLKRDLHNLTSVSGAWRERESEELGEIVQARIRHTQNPRDCASARKLVCNINKGCGYGCQLHHLLYCFLIAHGTQRTMLIESRGWRYSPQGGWEKYFRPLSDTCVVRGDAGPRHWGYGTDSAQVVELPIIDSIVPRPPYMPQAVPADLAPRLIRLHGHPFVWWAGQFLRYLLRPQPNLAADMDDVRRNLNFHGPIVGVHIRRTDKVHAEAAYHKLAEYMSHVDDFFDQLEADRQLSRATGPFPSEPVQRRIYLASDDPSVIEEAKTGYPQYEVISDVSFSKSAGLKSRYTDESLRAIILDIHFLSLTDHLVCTFSSQVCRIAYELMQTLHPDASARFTSLDDLYYFGGQTGHRQVALVAHSARPDFGEIDLEAGDLIEVAGNHWDGFTKGRNLRTGRQGVYPSYKVAETVDIAPYPTFNITAGSGGRAR